MENIILVVRVILKNNERRILFLKRATPTGFNKWALPGGKVEFGQTLEQACIEELEQETNLDIKNLRFFLYEEVLPSVINENHWLVFYFGADYSGEIRLNEESSDFHWISQEKLPDYKIAFNHEKIVQKYFER